jgi:hypothetical protein
VGRDVCRLDHRVKEIVNKDLHFVESFTVNSSMFLERKLNIGTLLFRSRK